MASHGVPRVAPTAAKSDKARQKELQKIKDYQRLVGTVQDKISAKEYTPTTLSLTSKLLDLNPEYYTVWNHRRLVLLHGLFPSPPDPTSPSTSTPHPLPLIRQDLNFLVPLLRQFPKCYWIWNHRLWLLHQATRLLPQTHSLSLWQDELVLVSKMLALDSRNFHGWGYRRTVVDQLERQQSSPETEGKIGHAYSMAEEEFTYTTKKISTDLSNYSAWHRRCTLIPRILAERGADDDARRAFFSNELSLIHSALFTDPYNQSTWFYHHWLFSTCQTSPPPHSVLPSLSTSAKQEALVAELDMLRELLDGYEDCKWIYEALIRYTRLAIALRDGVDGGDGGGRGRTDEERIEMAGWLAEIRKLDSFRRGRWDDLGRRLELD
ncbi:MAG: Rab geranylgeranyltransferase [Piccolia ochrophora]|nr:MAG: Rab geranylgeranyltransferase [Piccolia ochrophora]